jgi:hypothetical protein
VKIRISLIVLGGLLCITSVPAPDDIATAKAELLALHQADRQAHFDHNVDALLAAFPTEFIYLREGDIQRQSKEDMRQRFTEYFQGAEFTAWDDLEPPIIHVSPDGKMAWMIVRMKVAYTKTDSSGKKTEQNAVLAWLSCYEKHDGKWLHTANVTTAAP